mmetsp:Transcript_31142/g.85327  ORF Transcript_31142/g.85327 Transcript_31142/m.85327 type:complete len:99 (+) Transcript_31142:194-490(+)
MEPPAACGVAMGKAPPRTLVPAMPMRDSWAFIAGLGQVVRVPRPPARAALDAANSAAVCTRGCANTTGDGARPPGPGEWGSLALAQGDCGNLIAASGE